MEEFMKIEDKILKMLTSISYSESSRNKMLSFQTQNILKALEYHKAVIQIEKPKAVKQELK
jgi:hypothetical protein